MSEQSLTNGKYEIEEKTLPRNHPFYKQCDVLYYVKNKETGHYWFGCYVTPQAAQEQIAIQEKRDLEERCIPF